VLSTYLPWNSISAALWLHLVKERLHEDDTEDLRNSGQGGPLGLARAGRTVRIEKGKPASKGENPRPHGALLPRIGCRTTPGEG